MQKLKKIGAILVALVMMAAFIPALPTATAAELTTKPMVAAGTNYTIGLRVDGTVVATGRNTSGQCNVYGWRNIVAIAAGKAHTVGLKSDGTVLATGDNSSGQCNVSGWRDVIAVAASTNHTVGLKKDGTVVATGKYNTEVAAWTNIEYIAAGRMSKDKYSIVDVTMGIKKETGQVISTFNPGDFNTWYGYSGLVIGDGSVAGLAGGMVNVTKIFNTSSWSNIVSIAGDTGSNYLVGLNQNGSVNVRARTSSYLVNVSQWSNIVAISASSTHAAGLRADGRVFTAKVPTSSSDIGDTTGWNLNTPLRKISFSKGGGTGSWDTLSVADGGSVTITAQCVAAFTRKGYVFSHFLGSDGQTYKSGATIIVESDLKLTAKWTKVSAPAKAVTSLKLTSPKTKQIKVTYKKVSGAAGYRIEYSTSSKFTKSTTKSVHTTKLTYTIKSLKAKKTYYVRVTAYKVDSTKAKTYSKKTATKNLKTK